MTDGDGDRRAGTETLRFADGPLAAAVPIGRASGRMRDSVGPVGEATIAPPWRRVPDAELRPVADPVVIDVSEPAAASLPAEGAEAVITPRNPFTEGAGSVHPSRPGPHRVPAPRPPSGSVEQAARPRIVDEPGILGLSRRSRGRIGSRVFTLFFVAIFALIVIQMLAELLGG